MNSVDLNMAIMQSVHWATTRGISLISITRGEKNPNRPNWQQERLADPAAHFAIRVVNIGGLWGEPSDGAADVDLDHLEAVRLAPDYLPPTGAIYGRKSKQRSHWLYRVIDSFKTTQLRFPDTFDSRGKRVRGAMIIELRGTGAQTILPGSAHPNGELVEWAQMGEPAAIDAATLLAAVRALGKKIGAVIKPPRPPMVIPRPIAPRNFYDGRAVNRCRKYLSRLGDAVSGHGGHDATFHAACTIWRFGLSEADAWELLNWFNDAKCFPAWSERELRHKFDSSKAIVTAADECGSMVVTSEGRHANQVLASGGGC